MTYHHKARRICPLCRALTRFKIRMAQLEEPPERADLERLFTTGCWIIVALERTSPCAAHPRTLRLAKRMTDELARLVEEGRDMVLTTLTVSESEKGDSPVTYRDALPRLSTTVDLRTIYKEVYDTVPWPESIPSPEQITFRWKCKVTRVLGSCYAYNRIIAINPLYQDSRLHGEIKDLMTHEAGHFIWQGHPTSFKRFLRNVGVAPHYISSSSPPSAAFQAVYAEQSVLPYSGKCPACGAVSASVDGYLDVCCGCCARPGDPQLRLPFVRNEFAGPGASVRFPTASFQGARNVAKGGAS